MDVHLLVHILLLLFAIPRVSLGHGPNVQGEQNTQLNTRPKHPSCSDLVNLWQNMHRITRHSLTTNEIPVFPRDFVELIQRLSAPTTKTPDQQLSPYIQQIPFVDHDDPPNVFFKDSRGNGLLDSISGDLTEEDDLKGQTRNDNHPRNFGMFLLPQQNQQSLNPQILHEQFSRIQAEHHRHPSLKPEFDLLRFTPSSPKVHHVVHHPKQSSLHPPLPTTQEMSPGDSFLVGFEGFRSKSPPESMVNLPAINVEETDTKPKPDFGEDSEYYGPSKAETNFNVDDSFLGMFGNEVHDTKERNELNVDESKFFGSPAQWDDVEGFGSFGKFATDIQDDEDDVSVDALPSSRQTSGVQTPLIGTTWFVRPDDKDTRSESSEDFMVQEIPCLEVDGLPCTSDSHCACSGWVPLRCSLGKCSINGPQNLGDLDYGKWHAGPLPFSQLGIGRTRRTRNKKSTLV